MLNAPVLTTVSGKGVISDHHPLSAGTRLHFPTIREDLLAKADGFLFLGTHLSPTDFWQFKSTGEEVHVLQGMVQSAKLAVHVNVDEATLLECGISELKGNVEGEMKLSLQEDVETVMTSLLDELLEEFNDSEREASGDSDSESLPESMKNTPKRTKSYTTLVWNGQAHDIISKAIERAESDQVMTDTLMFEFEENSTHGGTLMRKTLGMIRNYLEANTSDDSNPVLVSDVCRIGYTALSSYQTQNPKEFIYPVGTTCLGFGLPAAIGACLSKEANNGMKSPVGLVVGDGGLQFCLTELAVAKANKLPLLIVVWNDESYGEIRRSLKSGFATDLSSGNRQCTPDFSKIAEAYGVTHFVTDEVDRSLEGLLNGEVNDAIVNGPVMLEIQRPWDEPVEKLVAVETFEDFQNFDTKTITTCIGGNSPNESVCSTSENTPLNSTVLFSEEQIVTNTPIQQANKKLRSAQPGQVLGTMTFGWAQSSKPINAETAAKILQVFLEKDLDCCEIDTARMYAGGKGEEIVAEALRLISNACDARNVKIATKVNPAGESGEADIVGGFADGELTKQAEECFKALKLDDSEYYPDEVSSVVDIFYLHWPDRSVELEVALKQVNDLYLNGRFRRFGLSNFCGNEVVEICRVCEEKNFVKPSVYQGLYNPLTRGVEEDLFPILRKNGLSFYAYNPLAGGLLTGKHHVKGLENLGEVQASDEKGRFVGNDFYKSRYGKIEVFQALSKLANACNESDITMLDATLRWMRHHSELKGFEGDKVILGCSSVQQLEENLRSYLDNGDLNSAPAVLKAFEEIQEITKDTQSSYAPYGVSGQDCAPVTKDTTTSKVSTKKYSILSHEIQNQGTELNLHFVDGSQYKFNSLWLRDAVPANANECYIRADAFEVLNCQGDGEVLESVTLDADTDSVTINLAFKDGRVLPARGDWLRSFAPFVAKDMLRESTSAKEATDGASTAGNTRFLTDELYGPPEDRNLWESEYGNLPHQNGGALHFQASDILNDPSTRIKGIEALSKDGVLIIRNLRKPASLDLEDVGIPLKEVANALCGRLYQHPRRKTPYGMMRTKMVMTNMKNLSDYNQAQPLAMHTDHAFISDGGSGTWQFMHQVKGSVKSKLVNGNAVAQYLKSVDPRAYELLATVEVTHGLRTLHYDEEGNYCSYEEGEMHDGVFEDCSTHPILTVMKTSDGREFLEKVSHQEIKRSVCDIPFELQVEWFAAYRKWISLCESEKFVTYVDWPEDSMMILNNAWILHGREINAARLKMDRLMVWGYVEKHILDNQYRLLKQEELLREAGVKGEWTSRIPNAVLGKMIHMHKE